jgi:hypothetical protein
MVRQNHEDKHMQSCIDDLLATFAIDMTFDSWIVIENVVGFLASSATCYNFGGQFQGHFHQGRTSEQKLQEINFVATFFEVFYL